MERKQNPVTEKMSSYAERMRDLINEAYAEGIALTVPGPEFSGTLLPVGDDEGTYRVVAEFPAATHLNLQLARPTQVHATAIVKKGEVGPLSIVSSVKLPTLPPPQKMVPVYNEHTASYFADVVAPWEENGVLTSALKFGRSFDFLALSDTDELRANGSTDPTDVIDPAIHLDRVFYLTEKGGFVIAEVGYRPYANAVAPIQGNWHEMVLDMPFKLNRTGAPLKDATPDDCFDLHITGKISLQLGTCRLEVKCDEPGITMLGYTLNINRVNPNRRPI